MESMASRPAWQSIGLTGLCLLVALAGSWSPVGQQVDAFAYDLLLRLRPPAGDSTSTVVVALDEETLRAYDGMAHLRRPLAEGLEVIGRANPKAVVVDVQLADRYDAVWDQRLARALASTPLLALAATLEQDRPTGAVSWEDPRPEFQTRAGLGHVHADPDPDGVSRRIRLELAAQGRRRWALAVEAFRLASGHSEIVETEETLELAGRSIPAVRREGRWLWVRYLPTGTLRRISLKQLIDQPALAAQLRDRVVFIGVTVQGGFDRLMTPYSDGVAMPGVEIHANLYETLARGRFLAPVSHLVAAAIAVAFAAAMGLCFHWVGGAAAFAAGFTLLAAAQAVPYVFFAADRVLPAAPPAAAAWLCFLTMGTRHYARARLGWRAAEAQRDRYQRAVHYVTHEMRTPLTAIQGSSELIGRYALSEEKRREIAALIHQESRRLARMVEMFLSVERLSAGQLELRREPVSTTAVLSSVLERARPLADRKQIRLHFEDQEAAEEEILGDREFLEYACYNLVTNAIKYSPAQTGIRISARRSAEQVLIAVEDEGYGMAPDEVRRVFQKFYRTRRARESGESGSGIGLALVEEIIVQHGGSIEVESRVNQGTRFTLALPRAGVRAARV